MALETNLAENMPKAFDSASLEAELYRNWEENGYFKPEVIEGLFERLGREIKKPFSMTLPPPNANGDLHIGHTCGYSFMDAMGRFRRMSGHPTLLLAGKDHAGIQTEAVFTKILEKNGESKWEMGREEFYKRCYEFCIESANNARSQEKRIGLSADWDREKFTLDPALTKTVYETFYSLLEEKLIYRGKRIINQCPTHRTALADIDTYHKELPGIFAYIIYPFAEESDRAISRERFGTEGITVATTRPETMLGDTAVAVNPKDDRYKDFIGKKLLLPIADREILVIGDAEIDMELGTGALKVTPAHSPVDFEMGKRHGLEVINVIGEEGKMVAPAPERFIGLGTVECSKALTAELDKLGLLVKIERIKHEVSVCERCDTPIEPIVSYQWFLDTEKMAKEALNSLNSGETEIIPEGQKNALKHFYDEIQQWCISRQLWWGHSIPVWYSGSKALHDWLLENEGKTYEDYEIETGNPANGTGVVFSGEIAPSFDENWGGDSSELKFEAETDVFDTWFSSGQWPYSTLMSREGDFEKFYPTNVMVHARDLIFFWTGRMLMLGNYKTRKAPFGKVFLHGMITAEDGTKMSKSRGNTVAPTVIFDKYGVDALRLWYYTNALPGSNAPLREEKIKGNRNFINKIWNASRFVLMNIDSRETGEINSYMETLSLSPDLKETLSTRLAETSAHRLKIIDYLENDKYHLAAESIREFFWGTLCDKWIEEVKNLVSSEEVLSETRIHELGELLFILKQNLKIMHPFIPYVTEAVWQELVKADLAEGWLIVEEF